MRKQRVRCVTTGEEFESVQAAAKAYNISSGALSTAISRKQFCGCTEDNVRLQWECIGTQRRKQAVRCLETNEVFASVAQLAKQLNTTQPFTHRHLTDGKLMLNGMSVHFEFIDKTTQHEKKPITAYVVHDNETGKIGFHATRGSLKFDNMYDATSCFWRQKIIDNKVRTEIIGKAMTKREADDMLLHAYLRIKDKHMVVNSNIGRYRISTIKKVLLACQDADEQTLVDTVKQQTTSLKHNNTRTCAHPGNVYTMTLSDGSVYVGVTKKDVNDAAKIVARTWKITTPYTVTIVCKCSDVRVGDLIHGVKLLASGTNLINDKLGPFLINVVRDALKVFATANEVIDDLLMGTNACKAKYVVYKVTCADGMYIGRTCGSAFARIRRHITTHTVLGRTLTKSELQTVQLQVLCKCTSLNEAKQAEYKATMDAVDTGEHVLNIIAGDAQGMKINRPSVNVVKRHHGQTTNAMLVKNNNVNHCPVVYEVTLDENVVYVGSTTRLLTDRLYRLVHDKRGALNKFIHEYNNGRVQIRLVSMHDTRQEAFDSEYSWTYKRINDGCKLANTNAGTKKIRK